MEKRGNRRNRQTSKPVSHPPEVAAYFNNLRVIEVMSGLKASHGHKLYLKAVAARKFESRLKGRLEKALGEEGIEDASRAERVAFILQALHVKYAMLADNLRKK